MNKKITANYKYELINAKPYLCVASVLEIIIKSSFNIDISQNIIAEYFGVNVSSSYSGDIKNKNIVNNLNRLGIVLEDNDINNFFKRYEIPLSEYFIPINTLQDGQFVEEIEKHLVSNNHLVCGYSYSRLFGKDSDDIGHVSIITEIDAGRAVTLLNPGPDDPGYVKVDVYDLYSSISYKKDGLWVITVLP